MFEDISLWTQSVDWVEIVVNFLLLFAPPLLVAAGILLSGTAAWKSFQALARAVRSSFDEATDPAVAWLATLTKLPPETIAKIAVGLFDAILQNDEARAVLEASGWTIPTTTSVNIADQPAREVNIGEAYNAPYQSSTMRWLDALPVDALERLATILESRDVPATPAGPPEDCAGDTPE